MTSKQSGFWGGLGGTLTGAAALITSLVGGVALFYFERDPGPAESDGGSVMADRSEGKSPDTHNISDRVSKPVPTDANQRAWRPEAIAARKDMFDARRAAWNVKCHKNRAETYARAEMTYRNAEEEFRGERYSVALESFKNAAAHYRECGKASN
jgi:hypothetical protein